MSYDLFFVGQAKPDRSDFFAHFESRANYELRDHQAWYANEDTGVYFAFDLPTLEEREGGEDEPEYWASFHLNFMRPHYFANEALIELDAFTTRFGRDVFDPQIDGLGDGPFDAAGFKRGWDRGNQFAVRSAVGANAAPGLHTRPTTTLYRIWRWNLTRGERQQQLGHTIFVPRISFYLTPQGPVSAAVWTDAIPIVLPKAEAVVLYKDELAPVKWLRRKTGAAVVPWADAESYVDRYRHESEPLEHWLLEYPERPEDIVAWFRKSGLAAGLQVFPMDQVLDSEVVRSPFDASG